MSRTAGSSNTEVTGGAGTDPLAALDDERLTALGLLVEAFSGVREAWEPQVEAAGITGSEFGVLVRLARSPGHRLRMSELAAQSTVTHSGLTRLIDRMVGAGMVERTPCETDRRGSYAQLTGAGIDLVVGLIPAHLATIDRVLVGPVGLDDLAGFLQALRRIRAVARPMSDPVASASVDLRPTS